MFVEGGQCASQFSPAKHVRERSTATVRVRSKDSAAERSLQVLKWLNVASVQLEFERRLLAVAGEGAGAHNQSHRVTQPERIHVGPV